MDEGRNQQQNNPGQSQGGSGQQHQSDTGRPAQGGGVSGLGDSDASRGSGQQGGALGAGQEHQQNSQRGSQGGTGQQQQFDKSGGQQGGGGSDSRFAEQIREHQEVIDDNGNHVGTVDHVDGDRIKLSRKDSDDGQHHYVLLSQVAGIEGDKVRLRERGDNDFGMAR